MRIPVALRERMPRMPLLMRWPVLGRRKELIPEVRLAREPEDLDPVARPDLDPDLDLDPVARPDLDPDQDLGRVVQVARAALVVSAMPEKQARP